MIHKWILGGYNLTGVWKIASNLIFLGIIAFGLVISFVYADEAGGFYGFSGSWYVKYFTI